MNGQVALVTGASSGIGAAFARELASRGFSLVVTARRGALLEQLRDELAAVPVDVLPADLTASDGAETVARRLRLGGIAIFVNNAGAGYRGRVIDQEDSNISRLVRLNFETPMILARAALGPMLARGAGGIVNVVSMGAFQPVPFLNVYSATKAGLLSFTEALADEVQGTGVRIQALCPGNIPTEFQEVAGTKGSRFDRTPSMSAAEVAQRSIDALLAGRPTLQIPGGLDWVSAFAQRFLPRSVARRVAGSLIRPE